MNNLNPKVNNKKFGWRKIIHYSLIICIILIQVVIGTYFYNEYMSRQKLQFIDRQLHDITLLDSMTDDARQELINAQDYFQTYITTRDNKDLAAYFNSVNRLAKDFDSISAYAQKDTRFKNFLKVKNLDSLKVKKLKTLIDSTYEISQKEDFSKKVEVPQLKKYDYHYEFEPYEVETKVFSDTVEKKGLFGRLKDAIAGKVSVRKDSTVVTMKSTEARNVEKMKRELDSIVNIINNYYSKDVERIKLNVVRTRDNSSRFFSTFNNLLGYSNQLMALYDTAIKNTKEDLQKEWMKQNEKRTDFQDNLILSLLILAFIVSIILMYFTRMAFLYEHKLKSANREIEENLNFKNRILGMLSHELRSPLKIIGLFLDRINKKNQDPNIKEYLKSIRFTNESLLMQANQILEYTKNQQVENKLVPSHFNLKEEINSILTSIEPYINTRNNKFVIQGNISQEFEIYSDKTKIHQLYMNIIGNANKFTENGTITVSVKAEKLSDEVVKFSTSIADTGAGISKKDLKNIFEPFYQGVISDEVENLGAGLGLSLCKELVNLYNGNISVDSEIGKGTTVRFDLNLNMHHE